MKKANKFIFWTPRILSIILILFLAIFSLDVFDSTSTPLQILLGLLMHNIPSFILLAVLIISWKNELVGAISFLLAGLLYIFLLVFTRNFQFFMISWIIMISGPAFLISYLFYLNYKKKKK